MKVARKAEEIHAAGARALFVVGDTPDRVRELMLHDIDSPFPVLVDGSKASYDAWGLPRASFATIWLDPDVWRQYWTLVRSGARFRGLGDDVRQLGGDFVVGPDGVLTYSRPQQRDDRPPAGPLVAHLLGGPAPPP